MRSWILLVMVLCGVVVLGLGCGPAAEAPDTTTTQAETEPKGTEAKAAPCCPTEAAAEKPEAAATEAKAAAATEAVKGTVAKAAAAATEAKGTEAKVTETKAPLTKQLAEAPKKLTEAGKAAAAPALKPAAPAATSPGKATKAKMMALMEATKTNDLAKIQAAAKDLCACAGKHKTKDATVAAKPDYQKMQAACMAAVKKVVDAKAAPDAVKAAGVAKGTCMSCHAVYKK